MTILMLAVFGLIFGSFVNALVWRLRKQDEIANPEIASKKEKRSDKTLARQDLSIARGRSMCPHCHHTLAAKDLVPVFSWLVLRGKCGYCKAPISWQYPLVELLTAILFGLSYVFWPYGFDVAGWLQFGAWLVFLVGFVALTVYDILWQELPDRVVWPLAVVAAIQTAFLAVVKHDWRILLWSILAVAVISGLFWLLFEISKGNWIGFGDVKLGIVLGLLAGTPLAALLVIFFASVLGTLASIPMLVNAKQKMKLHIPFGPFLIAGLIVVYFLGNTVVEWYSSLIY